MLQSLHARNFRLFTDLKICRLGRVNLIVGKNNTGKTAFLEMIRLVASEGSPEEIKRLLESRHETWFFDRNYADKPWTKHPARHLFAGHAFPEDGFEAVEIGELGDEPILRLGLGYSQSKRSEDGTVIEVLVPSPEDAALFRRLRRVLLIRHRDAPQQIVDLDHVETNGSSATRANGRFSRIEPPFQAVPTSGLAPTTVAMLWDITSLTEREDYVLDALRIMEPRTAKLAFVQFDNNYGHETLRMPLIRLTGTSEPLPLRSLGDGVNRLFHIVLAIVNARNGFVLLDEFENGLHWSVQEKVWEIIFGLAREMNVQVFATTHSRDCVRSFGQVWQANDQCGAFFRLEKSAGCVRAIEYTTETLLDSIETDVEVR